MGPIRFGRRTAHGLGAGGAAPVSMHSRVDGRLAPRQASQVSERGSLLPASAPDRKQSNSNGAQRSARGWDGRAEPVPLERRAQKGEHNTAAVAGVARLDGHSAAEAALLQEDARRRNRDK